MSVWNSVISVLGTLGGLLGGYWISSQMESRKRKHESEVEYRKEIKKHMDDIIKPLFTHLENLWGSLAILQVSIDQKSSVAKGKILKDLVLETQTANKALKDFVNSKYDEMSLLLPSPFPWVFAPLDELVEWKIIKPILQGGKPSDDMTIAVNTAMKIQKNLRRLVGFETDVEIESIYPFSKSDKPRDSENDDYKEKERFVAGSVGVFIAALIGAVTAKLMESYWAMPNLISQIIGGIFLVIPILLYSVFLNYVLYVGIKWARKRRRKRSKL